MIRKNKHQILEMQSQRRDRTFYRMDGSKLPASVRNLFPVPEQETDLKGTMNLFRNKNGPFRKR
ncbi:CLUMA_CG006451, isoform A [Clunio marinus]|uniref:CLUMA_CG006451, isoform A n=1 Tax=Clunio marinus TaxID=568069 RepID=A0A1J1HZQ4_9DIPT|nr:CLUMA_CG006451, isoform A [Clunio marinus]